MNKRIYSCLVISFMIKTSVANFCTIRNDGNCFYTVNCDNPTRINIVPYCKDTDPYITLTIKQSPAHNVTANFFNTKFDAYVRILTAVGNHWNSVQNYAFSNFKNVLYMDLSDNKIKSIDKAFSGLGQLDSLNLSRNQLEVIKPEVFLLTENKNTLALLDLSYNLLTYIPDEFFANLYNLRRLYLQGNYLTVLGDQHSANLKNLYYLNLCCNNFTALNVTLKYFTHLKELDLSHNQYRNIGVLEAASLETIILSHNILEEVLFDDFEQFPNLEELDLSYNKLKKIPSSTRPQNSDGTKPMIKLYLNNNNISHIDETFFINFNYIKLLNLSSNEIREIPKGTFKHVKMLSVLSVSNTKLKLTNETFLDLENTDMIDISQNNLTKLNPMFFTKCTGLSTIAADFNNLMTVDVNMFMKVVPSLVKITVEGNPLGKMSNKTISIFPTAVTALVLITNISVVVLVILFLLFGIVLLVIYARDRLRVNYALF